MRAASRLRRWLPLALLPSVAVCGADTPTDPAQRSKPGLASVARVWQFWTADPTYDWKKLGADHDQNTGIVLDSVLFGKVALYPPGWNDQSEDIVFSNATGETYWVGAKAPHASAANDSAKGAGVILYQEARYVIDSDNPKLTYTLTAIDLETIDGETFPPTARECRRNPSAQDDTCDPIETKVGFGLWAHPAADPTTHLISVQAFAELEGWANHWRTSVWTQNGDKPAFDEGDLDLTVDGEQANTHARYRLLNAIPYRIPLTGLSRGDTVVVNVKAMSTALDARQLESFGGAFLRDPVSPVGVSVEAEGVYLVALPPRMPTLAELEQPALPAPACSAGAQGSAGSLQFSAPQFFTTEGQLAGPSVTVTRTGGTSGLVSALISTTGGSATAGTDYEQVAAVVRFGDGEEGSRTISVPIHGDAIVEPDETVNLTLSEPQGCATLGGQTTATLTIWDDDDQAPPPPPAQFSIGGTVSGLAGSGLVLRDRISGLEARPTADGPFTIDAAQLDGSQYDVVVQTQPANPLQVCTVTNGSGTLAGADVTNIAVACTTPAPTGSLDPAFGSGGRVTATLAGGAAGMALQADGKIVVVGDSKVMRFNADGTPDQGFGTGGSADFTFPSATSNRPQGVVVQPDGKIVVVGWVQSISRDDFAVARYDASGAPDASFGTGGKVIVDFAATSARGWGVALQSDGAIVVAGQAAFPSGVSFDADFAVARLTTAGALDATFGTGGKTTINVAGATDWAYAVAIQPDGKIVLTGRAAVDGGSNPDIGLARLTTAGALDATFGTNGTVRTNLGMGDVWKEAFDLTIQPDGAILVTGEAQVQGVFEVLLARFTASGALDATFGTAGVTTTALTTQGDAAKGIALQPDGKIVVAGRAALFGTSDFAVARYTTGGVLDATFGGSGKVTVDFLSGNDGAEGVVVQPDGKIVAAGFARNGASTGLGLARIVP